MGSCLSRLGAEKLRIAAGSSLGEFGHFLCSGIKLH